MIEELIEKSFPAGLPYNSAAQLCLRLYCSTEGVPNEYHERCSKENLAEAFSKLSAIGFIKTKEHEAALYGANFHDVTEKGHWVEVIASIFKRGDTVDEYLGAESASCLTSLGSRC